MLGLLITGSAGDLTGTTILLLEFYIFYSGVKKSVIYVITTYQFPYRIQIETDKRCTYFTRQFVQVFVVVGVHGCFTRILKWL